MPSSKNYVRDYEQENKTAKARGETGKQANGPSDNAKRKKARRVVLKKGMCKGKDVDHIIPLSKGGTNAKSNLKCVPKSKNRSFKRTKTGAMA